MDATSCREGANGMILGHTQSLDTAWGSEYEVFKKSAGKLLTLCEVLHGY
jgi:hypothetical protein